MIQFKTNLLYVVFESISFLIINFNYKFINKEFENDKVWKVIFKSSTLTTFKTMVELAQIRIQFLFWFAKC